MFLVFQLMAAIAAAFTIGVELSTGIWEPILFLAASFVNSVLFTAARNVIIREWFVDNYSTFDNVLSTLSIIAFGYAISLFDGIKQLAMLTFMMFLVSMMYAHILATVKFLDSDG